MYITILANQSTMPPLKSLDAFLASHCIQVLSKELLPVARTLADRRCAEGWVLDAVGQDALALAFSAVGLDDGVDVNAQLPNDRLADIKLAVFDMDSTLIECEVIDELARRAGIGAAVSRITERAMCGELDFNQSFTERLSLLKDLDSAVINDIAADLPFSEGGKELMLTLKARGIKTVILSGGFRVFAERVAAELSMDDVYANTLDVEAGVLTGRVVAPIVNAEFKATTLKALARTMGIGLNQTLAVGDGANDLKMLSAAGIGIAFKAKPLVRAQARYQLSHVGLDGALYLIGSKDSKP